MLQCVLQCVAGRVAVCPRVAVMHGVSVCVAVCGAGRVAVCDVVRDAVRVAVRVTVSTLSPHSSNVSHI